MEQIVKIAGFIFDSFLHVWPYLLVTIPIAVIVQTSGAARHVNRVISQKPLVSIMLATVFGAFSPFCSCGVIPVITSLLIGGVPLAPVMSFWIASPSMDPEMFFLSTASIGWNLSVWRLVATFFISLSSGYFTHLLFKSGILGTQILRNSCEPRNLMYSLKRLQRIYVGFKEYLYSDNSSKKEKYRLLLSGNVPKLSVVSCRIDIGQRNNSPERDSGKQKESCQCKVSDQITIPSLRKRIWTESLKSVIMVCKFMTLAFFINALIHFYVPQQLVVGLLGGKGFASVITAAFVGIPVYTGNITALPLISGLISLGMNQGAALAFLIAGPITTLPAMSAVWGIVRIRIFLLYLAYSVFGAIFFGLVYNLLN